MKILVTGGAGFIGSAVIRHLIAETEHEVVNLDKLTYAGNLSSLSSVEQSSRYTLEQADICDAGKLASIFEKHRPDAVMHLAAETHVDRSIDSPSAFIMTNVVGTYHLLEASRDYLKAFPARRADFRFHHISTDEVYGDLEKTDPPFSETTPYAPSSPYSASKASSDHLVRAWFRTFGLPVLVTNCSNNYGPFHFPEKLIPLMILNALEGRRLPVYGDGEQVRDWLYVEDHARALMRVLEHGHIGETYNIGGHNEMTNLSVVETICDIVDELAPSQTLSPRRSLIEFVADRPGHDRRYAIDSGKINLDLNWQPSETFASGIRKTVEWYMENLAWCQTVQKSNYDRQRLGSSAWEPK